MKSLTLVFLLSLSTAFAIETKNCPATVNYELAQVDLVDLGNIELKFHQLKDYEKRIEKAQEYITKNSFISGSLKLYSKRSGKCYYQGLDFEGNASYGMLSGSTKKGASIPATFQLSFKGKTQIWFQVSQVKKSGLEMKDPNKGASVVYEISTCQSSDCRTEWPQIAYAKIATIDQADESVRVSKAIMREVDLALEESNYFPFGIDEACNYEAYYCSVARDCLYYAKVKVSAEVLGQN